MSRLVTVNVFREDTGESMAGIKVSLSGGYGESRTDRRGKATFVIPSDVSYICVYVNGSTAYDGYVSNIAKGLHVMVSPSGYFVKRV